MDDYKKILFKLSTIKFFIVVFFISSLYVQYVCAETLLSLDNAVSLKYAQGISDRRATDIEPSS